MVDMTAIEAVGKGRGNGMSERCPKTPRARKQERWLPSQARITAIRSPDKTGDSVSGSDGLEWRFIKTSNKGWGCKQPNLPTVNCGPSPRHTFCSQRAVPLPRLKEPSSGGCTTGRHPCFRKGSQVGRTSHDFTLIYRSPKKSTCSLPKDPNTAHQKEASTSRSRPPVTGAPRGMGRMHTGHRRWSLD